jgi:ABC-2 type transport system ATP-binding protein
MLEIRDICKRYGKLHAVDNLSYTFSNGIYGLLGPNGAGKTTLLNIIMGSLQADSGEVFYQKEPIQKKWSDFCAHTGYLPQNPIFYKDFSGAEFLAYMCELKNIPKNDRADQIIQCISEVNLLEALQKKIGAYSGGMRQRLGIAQVLLGNPDILIFDEPTAGLDPIERIRFRNTISRLSEEKTVIIATHIVPDIETIAKNVVIINEGKLTLSGKPQELAKSIQTKVWVEDVPVQEIDRYMEAYHISTITLEEDYYTVRMISEKQPTKNALVTSPKLEEVYLYYTSKAFQT